MTEQELARLLHIDEDDDLSIANAVMHKEAAEDYLLGAGVRKEYTPLYKQAIVVLVSRAVDRPDMLTKFDDMPGTGIVAMIAQLRRKQPSDSEVGA